MVTNRLKIRTRYGCLGQLPTKYPEKPLCTHLPVALNYSHLLSPLPPTTSHHPHSHNQIRAKGSPVLLNPKTHPSQWPPETPSAEPSSTVRISNPPVISPHFPSLPIQVIQPTTMPYIIQPIYTIASNRMKQSPALPSASSTNRALSPQTASPTISKTASLRT